MNYSNQNGQTISIITKTEIHIVLLECILYIECEGTLIKVFHTESDKPYYCTNTLKKLEADLTEFGFIRLIYNCLINMKHVDYSNAKNHEIHIRNGLTLPISRRKWHKLKAFLNT
jgi:DNA-binding LytR/AlgR family response regulator